MSVVVSAETITTFSKGIKATSSKNKIVKPLKKLHTLQDIRLTRTKINTNRKKSLHTLQDIKAKKRVVKTQKIKHIDSKNIVLSKTIKKSHTLKVSKLKKVVKKRVHTVKKKTKPVKLVKVLKKYAKPIALNKARTQKRVTLSDIFFKSSRSSNLLKNYKIGKATNIINIAKTKLGRRYVWGAIGQGGTFDCSGFTSYVYKKNGIHIPRTSRNQARYGKYVSRNNLKKGDLIFFDTSKRRKGYVNHVGIYLGNGKFIHASSAQKKVVVSSLSKFYAKRYVGARRPS